MMNNYQEERSLLEVREWKERCRLSNLHLTPEEYLSKLKQIAEEVKAKYHFNLPQMNLPLVE
jgi:hypothetical protein